MTSEEILRGCAARLAGLGLETGRPEAAAEWRERDRACRHGADALELLRDLLDDEARLSDVVIAARALLAEAGHE